MLYLLGPSAYFGFLGHVSCHHPHEADEDHVHRSNDALADKEQRDNNTNCNEAVGPAGYWSPRSMLTKVFPAFPRQRALHAIVHEQGANRHEKGQGYVRRENEVEDLESG